MEKRAQRTTESSPRAASSSVIYLIALLSPTARVKDDTEAKAKAEAALSWYVSTWAQLVASLEEAYLVVHHPTPLTPDPSPQARNNLCNSEAKRKQAKKAVKERRTTWIVCQRYQSNHVIELLHPQPPCQCPHPSVRTRSNLPRKESRENSAEMPR